MSELWHALDDLAPTVADHLTILQSEPSPVQCSVTQGVR